MLVLTARPVANHNPPLPNPLISLTLPPLPPMPSMPLLHPMRKERMLQRLGGGDPLLRVQRQTPLEEVDKMVELAAFRVRHAR